LLTAIAVVVVVLVVGLVVERVAGYSIGGQRLSHSLTATTPNVAGAPPSADSGSVVPPPSKPPVSFAPMSGVTKTSVLAKLPTSWKITTLTPSTTNDLAYVATTSTAVPDTTLRTVVGVSSPNSDQVSAVQCQFTKKGIGIDSHLLAAAKSCLDAVLPADDQEAAATWIDSTARALPTGAEKSERLHELQISIQHITDTFAVLVNTPTS
jgi:hypothetical protein